MKNYDFEILDKKSKPEFERMENEEYIYWSAKHDEYFVTAKGAALVNRWKNVGEPEQKWE